jgi:hypothetical protein
VVLFASVVVAVVLLVVLFSWVFQRRLIYLPSTAPCRRQPVAGARGPIRLVAVEGADHNDPALLNGDALRRQLWIRSLKAAVLETAGLARCGDAGGSVAEPRG